MRPRVLLVHGEAALVEAIAYHLFRAGMDSTTAANGDEALLQLGKTPPDLLVLDWQLPGISALEVCRRLRRDSRTQDLPVVILAARGEESERVRGLEVAADDYIAKPFSTAEFVARIRTVLRRRRPALVEERVTRGDLTLDFATRRVTRAGFPIALGPTEFRLLVFLLECPSRVFDRSQLLDAVWGHATEVEERTIDVAIRRLRKAINLPGLPDAIRTVRSAGYAFEPAPPSATPAPGSPPAANAGPSLGPYPPIGSGGRPGGTTAPRS